MTDYRPRPVFCVIDGANRNFERAEQVAAGWFELGGTTLELGTKPDWLGASFPADEEWRIELSKFYYGLDLAHAFDQTGDRRYLDCWLELVSSWIDQVPVDHDPTDVIARRLQNWTYAWARFVAGTSAGTRSPIGEAESQALLASIGRQVDYLRLNLATERNHRTLELYALYIVALAHPVLDPDGDLLRFAGFELYRNLQADVLADGVHRERSTHYHAIALRSFLGARINAKRFAVDLAGDFDERLALACDFLAAVMRPDGSLPMLSDSDGGEYGDLLHLAADHLGRGDLDWVASGGKQGEPPTDRDRSFPDGGYHVQRSGWGDGSTPYDEEGQLIFDCGPVGDSGHGHYDALHIEVAAGGRPLLVDPGRFTYSEHGPINWRHWFKGTAAHNTVCVDGLDQVPYRRGKAKGPTSQTRFLGRNEAHGVVSLTGEVISPHYDAIHRRQVLFVDRRWWLIEDTLSAVAPHHYDQRFHLAPAAFGCVERVGATVVAPGVTFLVGSPVEHVIELEEGYVAAEYGSRQPAPVLSISPANPAAVANTRFLTAVIPTPSGGPRPALTSIDRSHFEIQWGATTERVAFGDDELRWSQW